MTTPVPLGDGVGSCRRCGHPMCGRADRPGRGVREHHGRGLCRPCAVAEQRAGTWHRWPRTYRRGACLVARAEVLRTLGGLSRREQAAALGVAPKALEHAITRARRRDRMVAGVAR